MAAYQTEQGPLAAHELTKNIIRQWDPAYILLVGIAGSFQSEVKLGDVVVSQQVFHYDPGKATQSAIQYRPQGYPCSVTLIRQIEALFLDEKMYKAWQDSASESARKKAANLSSEKAPADEKKLLDHRPGIHFGTVASGSLVIASEDMHQGQVSTNNILLDVIVFDDRSRFKPSNETSESNRHGPQQIFSKTLTFLARNQARTFRATEEKRIWRKHFFPTNNQARRM